MLLEEINEEIDLLIHRRDHVNWNLDTTGTKRFYRKFWSQFDCNSSVNLLPFLSADDRLHFAQNLNTISSVSENKIDVDRGESKGDRNPNPLHALHRKAYISFLVSRLQRKDWNILLHFLLPTFQYFCFFTVKEKGTRFASVYPAERSTVVS